jgi:hypothetical protein
MNDIEDRLHDYFTTSAVNVADPTGARRIMRAATFRRRRRNLVMGALATVSVLAVGGTVVTRVREDAAIITGNTADQTPTTVTGVATTVGLDPGQLPDVPELPKSNVVWQRVDPTLSIGAGTGRSVQTDGSSFLAVSTLPGITLPDGSGFFNPPPALYTSTDGIEWSQHPSPAGVSLGAAMVSDGQLYVVGTSAKQSASIKDPGHLVLATSTGKDWRQIRLPFDPSAAVAKGAEVAIHGLSVSRFKNTTVVVATVSTMIDLSPYLPGDAKRDGYELRGDSVVLHGARTEGQRDCDAVTTVAGSVSAVSATVAQPERSSSSPFECNGVLVAPSVQQTIPLSELGIDPAVAKQIGERFVVFASDGDSFVEVPAPGLAGFKVSMIADSSGFVAAVSAVGNSGSRTEFSRSRDGRTWQSVGGVDGLLASLGVSYGKAVAVLRAPSGRGAVEVTVRPDDSLFLGNASTELGNVFDQSMGEGFAIGGHGVLSKANTRSARVRLVTFDVDGFRFTQVDSNPNESPAYDIAERYSTAASHAFGTAMSHGLRILDSADGVTFAQTKLSDLLDVEAEKVLNIGTLIADDNRLIVNIVCAPATDGGVPRTVTFVGRRP